MIFASLQAFFQSLSLLDYSVLIVNIVLMLFARPILARFSSGSHADKSLKTQVLILRGINFAILVMYGYSDLLLESQHKDPILKGLAILIIIYATYLLNYFARYLIFRSYGKVRTIGEKQTYIETYQTRALSLLVGLILFVIGLIACIHQMGFDSLLEAGGVIGILGVMVGLTQAAWAPDIISGLILLNSDVFEEGDVIEMPERNIGLIYKTKMFHTEILNISNNHRIMIRNSRLRDLIIHNLSKFASARGLRECLSFNIGYNVAPGKVKAMFDDASKHAQASSIAFEKQHQTEIKLLDTGDHALTWGFIYYVKNVEQLVSIRRDMRELIYHASILHEISLATPLTHEAHINSNAGLAPSVGQDDNLLHSQ